jgi:ABC-type antimicrobial peptide transport system permease subunit
MIKNFFKIAFRNLRRSRGFSVINIAGLAIGMASAIIILLWIQNELSYDQFHEKKDRIYETWNRTNYQGVSASFQGTINCWNVTPMIFARTLERDIPEVERAVRVHWDNNILLSIGDKKIMKSGNVVDTGFFQMFSFTLLKGNPATVLNDMHSIVLTASTAESLFGKETAMGKVIKVDNTDNFTVTGIVKDPPNNTRFRFEYLLPWSYLQSRHEEDSNWNNNNTRTYVLLKQNASYASAASKVKVLKQKYDKDAKQDKWEMFIYPASRWRLYSTFTNGVEDNNGRITFVKLFGIIATFILLIACINFMNLSTAHSEKRAKEVGIRKVIGAQRAALIGQFIGESILLAFIAGLIALVLVQLNLSWFNQLTQKKLFLPFGDFYFWLMAIAFVILTGFLAGSYPAFFLSSFQPVRVLKGTFKKTEALVTPRKVLVVLQFTFAIVLIICTFIVKQQIDYAKSRDNGYNKDQLAFHPLSGDLKKNYMLVKNELLSSGVAAAVTKTNSPITSVWSTGNGEAWEGKDPNDKTEFQRLVADDGLAKTVGFTFIAGRDFNLEKFKTDSLGMLLNESTLKLMKFKDPIGQIVKAGGKDWHVIGVVKDFIIANPYEPVRPLLVYGAARDWFATMMIKFNDKNRMADNMRLAGNIFKKYNYDYPFDMKFVDLEYARKFENEQQQGILAALFAGLAIFISCLGLFGLVTYMAGARVKEIGVRKVLGASVASITTLLSKDFLKLVFIAILIASPIAWLAMHKWLEGYNYRVPIHISVFIVAGLLAIMIALFTVSFQAMKAALANPAKSLRTE